MKDYNIEFYSLNNGEEPAKTFIYNLEPKMKAKIIKILDMLQKDGKIILTNGFIKKTMKTPKSEIEKAKKYKSDYERRREHDQL